MNDARLWLVMLVAPPLLVVVASYVRFDVERLRRFAVGSAIFMLLAALVVTVSPSGRELSIRSSALTWVSGGEAIIRIDTLSAVLLPFAAGLWLSRSRSRRVGRSIAADCAGRRSPRLSRSPLFSPRVRSCWFCCRWRRCGLFCQLFRSRRIGVSDASQPCIWGFRR